MLSPRGKRGLEANAKIFGLGLDATASSSSSCNAGLVLTNWLSSWPPCQSSIHVI